MHSKVENKQKWIEYIENSPKNIYWLKLIDVGGPGSKLDPKAPLKFMFNMDELKTYFRVVPNTNTQ